jgi:hypothetical protein
MALEIGLARRLDLPLSLGKSANFGTLTPRSWSYSSRSVLAGSILAIRNTGTVEASSVTRMSATITASMVGASYPSRQLHG